MHGGALYLFADTSVSVHLISSKTKIAPLKTQTIPRLELCGALMLSRLLFQGAKDLDIPPESVFAWTDSTVVLGWINTPPHKLKVFVSHRVTDLTSNQTSGATLTHIVVCPGS